MLKQYVEDVQSVITEARKRGVICILLAANRDATELAKECGMDEKIAMTMGNDPHTQNSYGFYKYNDPWD